ncbi:MAG: hypothetical protein GY866_09985, partial [Proteobacteria bacterium]|nr:hypothetical protein [Pseudomonadota bacterium]
EHSLAGPINNIGFVLNRFFLTGDSGRLYSSFDGRYWVELPTGTNRDIHDVIYGNGKYVAVGIGMSGTSTDGSKWDFAEASVSMGRIAWGNGTFVGVSHGGRLSFTSIDGVNWSLYQIYMDSGDLKNIVFANNRFVTFHGDTNVFFTSPNGSVWTAYPYNYSWNTNTLVVDASNDVYLLGVKNAIYKTSDLVHWSEVQAGSNPLDQSGDYDQIVATDSRLVVSTSNANEVAVSTDGKTWNSYSIDSYHVVRKLCAGENKIVGVGDYGTIVASSDGTVWNTIGSGTSAWLTNARYVNGYYVALGEGGTILTSPYGQIWTPRSSGVDNTLLDIAFGNGTYVISGSLGLILKSTDLAVWEVRESNSDSMLDRIEYANGRFVVHRQNPDGFLASEDGTAWESEDVAWSLYDIIPIPEGFLTISSNGRQIFSDDGLNWIPITELNADNEQINDIVVKNGKYYAVGANRLILESK